MSIGFLQPWALAGLALLPFFFVLGRPRLRRLPGWMRHVAMSLRLLIVALVVLALAQPVIGRTNENVSVIFAVDQSDSIAPETRAQAEMFVQQALSQVNEKNHAGLVVFGRDSIVRRSVDGAQVTGANVSSDGAG